MPHNVVATGINTEAVLGSGQNPPPSKSHTGNTQQLTQRKYKTQSCWGQMHGIGPNEIMGGKSDPSNDIPKLPKRTSPESK